MTMQIAVKLSDEMLAALDELVTAGHFESRSGAVRAGVREILRQTARRGTDLKFAEGFRRSPESEAELADAYRLAFEAIEDEPWERWW
jgi:Arc/MetJ-type ribon-helix-helix transcriptional regulator